EYLQYMSLAVNQLIAIPEDLRAPSSGEEWAASASLQLTLYQSGYSVMHLNKFAYSASSGGVVDLARLETMTDADAEAIIENLAAAAAVQQGGQGEQVAEAVARAQAQIDS